MPFHVLFSFTVWKDVLWSGCVTLFITALYRVFFRVGRNLRLNHVWMGLGAVGFCLLRSNGWFAFAILTVVFCLLFFRQYPRVALTLLCVLAVTWFLKNPVLNWLGVTPPDTIEHLSIPAQQIAYVLGVSGTITEEDRALLSQIIDLEKAGEAYLPYLSDPIKNLVREKGNQHLLTENKMEYLMLWLRTGLNNPRSYLYAWIEQTRGYYNAGHHYWIWSNETYENAWQISRQVASQPIAAAWENYSKAFRYSSLCIFVSVGFHMWLAAGSFVLCAARKRWREAFLSLPVLTILLSLLVATPVAYEFRYIYALFTSLPLLLFLPGCSHEREEQTAR